MKIKLIAAAALALALSANAKVTAFTQGTDGSRFSLTDDVCTEFENADGVAIFTGSEPGVVFEGCWKYDKETNTVFIAIEGRIYELPADMFTST